MSRIQQSCTIPFWKCSDLVDFKDFVYLESDHLSFFTYPNIQTRRFTSAFHRALVVRGGNGLQFFTVPRGEELPPLPKKIVEEEGTDEDSVRSVTPDSTEPPPTWDQIDYSLGTNSFQVIVSYCATKVPVVQIVLTTSALLSKPVEAPASQPPQNQLKSPGKEACASEPLLSAAVILSNFIY